MKTRAEAGPEDPPLPPPTRTETTLKRDDWMLEPGPTTSAVTASSSSFKVARGDEDVDMMDGYGDAAANSRNMSGGVDFFSSLGTERKKKPKPTAAVDIAPTPKPPPKAKTAPSIKSIARTATDRAKAALAQSRKIKA